MTFKVVVFFIFSFGAHFWWRKTIFEDYFEFGPAVQMSFKCVCFSILAMATICMRTKTAVRTIFSQKALKPNSRTKHRHYLVLNFPTHVILILGCIGPYKRKTFE